MRRSIGLWSGIIGLATLASAAEPTVVNLWPGKPPGEIKELPPEENVAKESDKPVGDRRIVKITNVSIPTLSIYRAAGPGPKTAVIVCPGGGHNILAFDHEGTEVAEWLVKKGVTALVLKYRVPARSHQDERWQAAVQDGQRAVSLTRQHAAEWGIDPQRIGMVGFSAGGETAGRSALLHAKRHYPTVDGIDAVSCRPDFVGLVYPGGLNPQNESWTLRDNVQVDATTPPMFFAHAADDRVPVSNSVLLFAALHKAKVPAEMHVYASGGHGFGMRQTGHPCNSWPDQFLDWMKDQGWVGK